MYLAPTFLCSRLPHRSRPGSSKSGRSRESGTDITRMTMGLTLRRTARRISRLKSVRAVIPSAYTLAARPPGCCCTPSIDHQHPLWGLDCYPPMADNRNTLELIETSTFTRQMTALLSDEDYGEFQSRLAAKQI